MNDMIDQIFDERINVANMDELVDKGLYMDGKLTNKFYLLYKNYKILLEKFLIDRLPLLEYDNKIYNSGLFFTPVKKEDMDIYQLLSTMNLRYFYLRNILNVDKLSFDDINYVVNLSNGEIVNFDDKLFEFVNRTYKDVLNSNRENNDNIHMVCYGTDRDYYWHDSKDLIFGFRYDKYADNGLGHDKEWLNNSFEQYKLISICLGELNKECSKRLELNVYFLNYDDVSVIKSMRRK